MTKEIPIITGPGDFDIQVVGQRRRQAELVRICGPHCSAGYDLIVRAQLSLNEQNEFDSKAVSVRVDGGLVGYLPMDIALDFRRAVIAGELEGYTTFECGAAIRGGRDRGNEGTDEFRISLDLPQEPDTNNASTVRTPTRALREQDNPLIGAYRSEALVDRQIDELIGIIKGVTADGMVTQAEVEYLLCWMDANRKAAHQWPAKVIYPRLVDAIHGGTMSIEKESEVLELLMRAVGGNTATRDGHQSDSSKLPYVGMDVPVSFHGKNFWGCTEFCVNGFSFKPAAPGLQTGWRSGSVQLSSHVLASSTFC